MTTTTGSYSLGGPYVAGPLAVYPVFGPAPRLAYHGLAKAINLGASIKELGGETSIGEFLVENPTDLPILVYEGDHLTGGRQHRMFDAAILVPAKSQIRALVSCTELAPGRASQANEATGSSGRDRAPSWSAAVARLEAFGVQSATYDRDDVNDAHRDTWPIFKEALSPKPSQVGVIVEIWRRVVALELISRSDVFAELAHPLAIGYAMQASRSKALRTAEALPGHAPDAARFLAAALNAPQASLPNPGIGSAFKLTEHSLVGAGLEHDGELIALSAFPQAAELRAR